MIDDEDNIPRRKKYTDIYFMRYDKSCLTKTVGEKRLSFASSFVYAVVVFFSSFVNH